MTKPGPTFQPGVEQSGVVSVGTVVVNGATPVAVSDKAIRLTSFVEFSLNTVGGTPAGQPFLSAITSGSGFSVEAVAGDTSTYNYRITNP